MLLASSHAVSMPVPSGGGGGVQASSVTGQKEKTHLPMLKI